MKVTSMHRRAMVLVAVSLSVSGPLVLIASGRAPAAETPQLQGLHLVAAHSAKTAAVANGSTADGAKVVQASEGALNSQGWLAIPFGPSWVFMNLNSNKVLDVAGASKQVGAPVIQWEWNGGSNQIWTLLPFGPSQVVFVNFNSGKVMDVSGASLAEGAALTQWDWNGGANQVWQEVGVGPPASTTTTTAATTTTRASTTTTTRASTTTTTRATTTTTRATTTTTAGGLLDTEEAALCRSINSYRAQNGLPPLLVSSPLTNAAQWLSTDMAQKNYFSHTDSLGRDQAQRVAAFGYSAPSTAGENLAAGAATAAATFTQWKNDPPHNANMLQSSYRAIGIGRAYQASSQYGWYWTATFGGVNEGGVPCPA